MASRMFKHFFFAQDMQIHAERLEADDLFITAAACSILSALFFSVDTTEFEDHLKKYKEDEKKHQGGSSKSSAQKSSDGTPSKIKIGSCAGDYKKFKKYVAGKAAVAFSITGNDTKRRRVQIQQNPRHLLRLIFSLARPY